MYGHLRSHPGERQPRSKLAIAAASEGPREEEVVLRTLTKASNTTLPEVVAALLLLPDAESLRNPPRTDFDGPTALDLDQDKPESSRQKIYTSGSGNRIYPCGIHFQFQAVSSSYQALGGHTASQDKNKDQCCYSYQSRGTGERNGKHRAQPQLLRPELLRPAGARRLLEAALKRTESSSSGHFAKKDIRGVILY